MKHQDDPRGTESFPQDTHAVSVHDCSKAETARAGMPICVTDVTSALLHIKAAYDHHTTFERWEKQPVWVREHRKHAAAVGCFLLTQRSCRKYRA